MKVAISGYYGYGNVGDEALLAALLDRLGKGGFRPLVLSGDPAATRALHGVAAANRAVGLVPALLRSQALVSGGGGLLQDRTSARSLAYYLGVIGLARRLGRRVVVYGQSIGPLSDSGRRKVARALNGVPVAVRDEASQGLLRELGVAAHLTADPALLLDVTPQETGVPPALPMELTGDTAVLLPRAGHPDINRALRVLAQELSASNIPALVVAMQPELDGQPALEVAEGLAGVHAHPASTHAEVLQIVSRAGIVVSARLHGLILAAAAQRPIVGLSYDPKVAAFMAEVGAPFFREPVDIRGLLHATAQREPVDAVKLASLQARARSGIDWLLHSLRGDG